MKVRLIVSLLAAVVAVAICSQPASAADRRHRVARQQAQAYTWHGWHYHSAYGEPVALVVPPTASRQVNYGWGVGNTRVTRLNHQFSPVWPGTYGRGRFAPTPAWPRDTHQFGAYSVRGPW